MTNYEYLKTMIDNKAAVETFFCRMIESTIGPDEYCDYLCPMADKCKRGKSGFAKWLDEEHKTVMADWGKYDTSKQ